MTKITQDNPNLAHYFAAIVVGFTLAEAGEDATKAGPIGRATAIADMLRILLPLRLAQ
jgi:hypothetical protein